MHNVRTLISFKILLLFLGISACAQNDRVAGASTGSENTVIIISETGEHRFSVEFANDDEERRVGLMYRTEMAENAGMLFDFGEPQPVSMWMKNTLIPLDMAFIDKDGVIQRIAANTTPRSLESIPSGALVTGVLEVNGGVFEKLGVKPGDKVKHSMFKTQ